MDSTSKSTCPICGCSVDGHINHQYIRKGAEFGAKIAAKHGGGAIGGAVGSIFGPVGTVLGTVAGKLLAGKAAEAGSEYVQNNYTPQYHKYHCPICEVEWISTDNRRKVIDDYFEDQLNAAETDTIDKIAKYVGVFLGPYAILLVLEILCLLLYGLYAILGVFMGDFKEALGILKWALWYTKWFLPIIIIICAIIYISFLVKKKGLLKRKEESLRREGYLPQTHAVIPPKKVVEDVATPSDNVITLLNIGQRQKAFVEYFRESKLDIKEAKALFDNYCSKNGY